MDEQNWNQPNWQPPQGQPMYRQPVNNYPMNFTPEMLPPQYRPLSAWAYFGLTVLFSIPVVGLVFLIIFSFNSDNINRRSFARSYWCMLLLSVVLFLIVFVIAMVAGVSLDALDDLRYYY